MCREFNGELECYNDVQRLEFWRIIIFMEKRYRQGIDILFFLLIFTLIFTYIPKPISLDFFGSTGRELAIYPLGIGMIMTTAYGCFISKNKSLYTEIINDEFLISFIRGIKCYFGILLLVLSCSVILGVIYYPYFGQLLNDATFLPARLVHIVEVFHISDISASGVKVWLIFKGLKNVFLDTFFLFGGAFLIYLWYRNRPDRCFKLLIDGIFVSLGIIFLYELIEIPYLLGSQTAANILTAINPYIHQIGALNNHYVGNNADAVKAFAWWPPLLWKHQVRSVFAEPSFLGLYCAFAIPWIWYLWFQDRRNRLLSVNNITLVVVMGLLYFLVFATQARTALLLFIGEFILLIFYGLYRKNKGTLKKICVIFLLIGIAFFANLAFVQVENSEYFGNNNAELSLEEASQNYVSANITSAVGKDKRSNRARFSLMEAEIKVWLEHPALGVGKGLKAAYIPEKLPADSIKSSEVRMWLNRLHANGALKASFPDVSEYTAKLCEMGFLGCTLYYLPAFYLFFYFLYFLWKSRDHSQFQGLQDRVSFYLISLSGMLAGGVSTSLNVNYCFAILLGIGCILYQRIKESEIKETN